MVTVVTAVDTLVVTGEDTKQHDTMILDTIVVERDITIIEDKLAEIEVILWSLSLSIPRGLVGED